VDRSREVGVPFFFYAAIAVCGALVLLRLWMIVGTESYWRAKNWLVVRNVREAEPHPASLIGYKLAGVVVIVASVWVGVTVTQSMIDKKRQADREELFGYEEVLVAEPEKGEGEIRAKKALGPRYYEATQERLDLFEGVDDAELLVAAGPWVEEVSVDEADGVSWSRCCTR
jgi:hypothetical protein